MSERLNNDEIREKLIKLNYDCGPVTDTTRQIHLKKLRALAAASSDLLGHLPDDQLRAQLAALGESVGPITPDNRPTYIKKLRRLKRRLGARDEHPAGNDGRSTAPCDGDDCEPMEVD